MKLPENFLERLIELNAEIQQCPAPSYQEQKRAALIETKFLEHGLLDVSTDHVFNVYGRLPGAGGKPLVISAHLDTVFPDTNGLSFERKDGRLCGPGIGDNSLGVTGLFGILWMLQVNKVKPQGDIWFVGNSCEEGLGDLRGMKAVVERLGAEPLTYLVLEGMGVERIVNAGLGSKRYLVEVATQGGHSWGDYGKPSAIHEMVRICNSLLRVRIPRKPRTSFNIGKINGGTSVNTIAGKCSVELDLRSVDATVLNKTADSILRIVESFNSETVTVTATPIGDRPTGMLPRNHPLVNLAKRALKKQKLKAAIETSSTDCNIPLSQGIPSICLGITHGKFAHTYDEYIELDPVIPGMKQLYEVVTRVWKTLG